MFQIPLKKFFFSLFFFILFAFNINTILNANNSELKVISEVNAKSETCYGKWVFYESYQKCRCEPIQLGDQWQCTGCWSWSISC